MSAGRPREPGDSRASRDASATGGERFADLVGDARRLEPRPPPARRPASTGRERVARPPRDSPPASFRWPDADERHLAAAPGINDVLLLRLRRGEPEPEERIDLHGTRVDAARRLLDQRLASARARGLRCVLVVHGRGKGSPTDEAPLRDAIPAWLTRGENGRRVLAFAPAPKRLGGEGATLVLLRKEAEA